MATKLLLKSNATTAIAVSGNAMSDQDDPDSMKKMAEVFIGVATYVKDPNSNETVVVVRTKVFNFCDENAEIRSMCKLWHDTPIEKKQLYKSPVIKKIINSKFPSNSVLGDYKHYNSLIITSLLSRIIRQYTTFNALELCINLLITVFNNLTVPTFVYDNVNNNSNINDMIKEREELSRLKVQDLETSFLDNVMGPSAKNDLFKDSNNIICINSNCHNTTRQGRDTTAQYKNKYLKYKNKYERFKFSLENPN
jgi:hypothetical protein